MTLLFIESGLDLHVIECLQPSEAAQAFAAFLHLVIGIQSVERIKIAVVKSNAIIPDDKIRDWGVFLIQQAWLALDLNVDDACSCTKAIKTTHPIK
jgi:hypothetical protein